MNNKKNIQEYQFKKNWVGNYGLNGINIITVKYEQKEGIYCIQCIIPHIFICCDT